MPVNSGSIRHLVEDINDKLVTAVNLNQRTWELT